MLASSWSSSSSWISSKRTSASGRWLRCRCGRSPGATARRRWHALTAPGGATFQWAARAALVELGRPCCLTWGGASVQALDHVLDQRAGLLQHRLDAVMQGRLQASGSSDTPRRRIRNFFIVFAILAGARCRRQLSPCSPCLHALQLVTLRAKRRFPDPASRHHAANMRQYVRCALQLRATSAHCWGLCHRDPRSRSHL